jgi:hypothetical protein
LVLSVCLASQQLAKSRILSTLLPRGQIGYLVVVRSWKPVQVQLARALAGPLTPA